MVRFEVGKIINDNGIVNYADKVRQYNDKQILIQAGNAIIPVNISDIDKSNSVPVITGTTAGEIADELATNFFFEGFNLAQNQIESGYLYSLQENNGTAYANSANIPANTAVAIPILIEKPISFNLLQIHLVNAGVGISLLGAIYDNGDIGAPFDKQVPKTKLFDLATLTSELETTGTKTVDSTLRTLQPGLYWWVYLCDTANQIRLRGKSSNDSIPYLASGITQVSSAPVNHMEQARLHSLGLPAEWTTAWTNKVSTNFTLPYLWFSKS